MLGLLDHGQRQHARHASEGLKQSCIEEGVLRTTPYVLQYE